MGLRIIKYFYDVPEAFIAKEYLSHFGIFASLRDHHHIQTNYYYSQALGNVKLQVIEEEAEKAASLLNDIDKEYADRDENKCHSCLSSRTVRVYKYTIWQIPVLLFSIIPQFPLVLFPKKFSHIKCNACKANTYPKFDEDDSFEPSLIE